MFARRWFGGRYFGPAYWGDGGDIVVETGQTPRATRYRRGYRANWRHGVAALLVMLGGWR